MQLEEFFDYKNQLMNDLLTNEEIVRLLADDCKPVNDVQDLVYKQVFPYEYIPETIEHGQTFICCDVDIQKSVNKTFLIPVLYIWVFSHKSKLRLPKEPAVGFVLINCVPRLRRLLMAVDTTVSVSWIYTL